MNTNNPAQRICRECGRSVDPREDVLLRRCYACRKARPRRRSTEKRERGPQRVRKTPTAYRLMWKYRLAIEDFNQLLDAQGGVCAICGRYPPEGRTLGVDHDHRTGRVRGLLCTACNVGLGCFKDDPDLLMRTIHYLLGEETQDA